MSDAAVLVRPATRADLEVLGRLGAHLMQVHYDFDRRRFIAPSGDPAAGYARFLRSQIDDDDATVLVAERDGRVVGYVYAAIEPFSWKDLRDEAGYIHDIVVEAGDRRTGVAGALMTAAVEWVRGRGLRSVMLGTAAANDGAQRLFERLGFRRTMVEMTLDL